MGHPARSILGSTVLALSLLCGVAGAQEDAKAAPVAVRVVPDVAYVAGPKAHRLQRLDVYAPRQGAKHPVLVFIHGGGWRIGDKRSGAEKGRFFAAEHGFVVVSVNYRLSPVVQHPEHARDVAAALGWTRRNVADYGGDPERIYLMGHSAGAHLAALAPLHHALLEEQGLPAEGVVRGVILLDGAGYDVRERIEAGRPRARKIYTGAFGSDPKMWADASPIAHAVSCKAPPPFLILYVADRNASRLQSEALAKALRKADGKAWVVGAEGKTHATINREIGKPGDAPTASILRFLSALERGEEPQLDRR